jgi:oxalate decarboxylase
VTDDAVRFGDPRIPAETITDNSHLFRLGAVAPTNYDGGSLQQAHEDNFPILKGQEASIQLVGDVVFAPQGSFHYFENRDPDDMKIVIIQNTSAPEDKDNIGVGESLSRMPPRVLSAIFGVPAETFSAFKKIDGSIVILRST